MLPKKLYILAYLTSAPILYVHATLAPTDSKEKKEQEYDQLQKETGDAALNILPPEIFGIITDYSQGYFDKQQVIHDPQASYPLHKKSVTCLASLPSKNVLSGSEDKTIKEFDPATGKVVRTYFAQEWVTCLCPVSRGFLSGSYDRTMKEWTTGNNGGLKAIYKDAIHGHKQAISSLAVLSNGNFLSGANDGLIIAWNPKTHKMIRAYIGHTGKITNLIPLPDGDFISVSNDKTQKEWNGATGQTKNTYKSPLRFMVPLKSGNLAGIVDKKMVEFDKDTGKAKRTYSGQASEVTNIAALPSGNIIVSTHTGEIIEWDTDKGAMIRIFQDVQKSPITSLIILPSGTILAGSEDGFVREWNPNPKSTTELALERHKATAQKTPKQPLLKKDSQ